MLNKIDIDGIGIIGEQLFERCNESLDSRLRHYMWLDLRNKIRDPVETQIYQVHGCIRAYAIGRPDTFIGLRDVFAFG